MRRNPVWLVTLGTSLMLAAAALSLLAQTKKAAPGNGWSSAAAISPVGQPDPTRGSQLNDVAVSASGVAVAAWDQYTYNAGGAYSIGAAVQTGGKWGPPFTVSGTSGFSLNPKVAIGAEGTMAVSWVYQDRALTLQKMQVASKSPGAAAWTTATLAQGPIGGVAIVGFVPVGIDANGNITAAWTIWDGSRHIVQAATLPKGGTWSAPVILSGPTTDGLYLSLAVNARGDAAVAYTISPYASYPAGTYAEFVFRAGPNGPWSQPVVVSKTIPNTAGYVTAPQVGLDANGLATVIYLGYGVEAVRELTRGTWTNPQIVLAAPNRVSSFSSPDLAVDDLGNAVVAASIFDATIGVDRSSAWVTLGTPSGTWSLPQRLTDPVAPVDAYATRVARSPDGALVMVGWIDHYHGTVQVTRFAGGLWGPAITIGRGTAFSSFQEVLGLRAAASDVARAVWKNAKSGTQTMAASYGK